MKAFTSEYHSKNIGLLVILDLSASSTAGEGLVLAASSRSPALDRTTNFAILLMLLHEMPPDVRVFQCIYFHTYSLRLSSAAVLTMCCRHRQQLSVIIGIALIMLSFNFNHCDFIIAFAV